MALDYISIIDTLYELFLWNSLCSDNCLGSWARLLSARLKVCGCNETCLRSRLNAQVLKVWIVIDVRVCCSWWLKHMHTGGPNVWCFFWVKRDNVSAVFCFTHTFLYPPSNIPKTFSHSTQSSPPELSVPKSLSSPSNKSLGMLSVAGTILSKSLLDSDLTVVPLFFSSHTTKD